MCIPKPRDMRLSYKDAFNAARRTLTGPIRYNVPSQITARERQVEILPAEDGVSIVRWWYQDGGYEEEYRLRVRLDQGSVPQSDGSGVFSNGHQVRLEFYKRVAPGR